MKNIFFFLFLFAGLQSASAQIVVSSCNASDSVISEYKDDADRMTENYIYLIGSSYEDSVNIPRKWSDTVLNALIAVYNATSLPARDTVVSVYNIHVYPWISLTGFSVEADSSLSWMHQLRIGNLNTGNASIDSLISTFHLQVISYFNYFDDFAFHSVEFKSDSNYNINVITNLFTKIPGVYYSNPDVAAGDGNDITDTIYSNYIDLSYSLGLGDCPSGCTDRIYWYFRVYYNCTVEYLGRYNTGGWNSITAIGNKNITIYPNPFSKSIFVEGLPHNCEYILSNSLGQIIFKGITTGTELMGFENIPPGIYFLQLKTGDSVINRKLIKE